MGIRGFALALVRDIISSCTAFSSCCFSLPHSHQQCVHLWWTVWAHISAIYFNETPPLIKNSEADSGVLLQQNWAWRNDRKVTQTSAVLLANTIVCHMCVEQSTAIHRLRVATAAVPMCSVSIFTTFPGRRSAASFCQRQRGKPKAFTT